MATYGLIAGEKTNVLIDKINNNKKITVDSSWNTTVQLSREIINQPTILIDEMTSILLVDSGFPPNLVTAKDKALDFLKLQDLMESRDFEHVKLYFVTKNVELYEILKGKIKGCDGIHYRNTEMFLEKGTITIASIIEILKGTMDKRGVYSKKNKNLNTIERLEREKQALIEDAQNVSKESLEFGKKEPVSQLNQKDILNSDQFNKESKELELKKRKLEREIDQIKKKNQKGKGKPKNTKGKSQPTEQGNSNNYNGKQVELIIGTTPEEQEGYIEKEEPIKKQRFKEPKSINVTDMVGANSSTLFKDNVSVQTNRKATFVPTDSELKELYTRLAQVDNDTIEKKLKSDLGVISVIGTENAGSSGFVAQMAEVYAMLNKKVLIIDLDIILRSQTMYFPTYSDVVLNHKGVSNSLIKQTQVLNLKENAVPVTSNIYLLSNEKTNGEVKEGFHSTITDVFEQIIDEANKMFDIVIIDLPLKYLSYYIRHSDIIDKNIFVLENKFYKIEDFFSIELNDAVNTNDIFTKELLNKSSIVLNKFRKDFRDLDGYQLNRLKVKKMLLDVGSPYDSIQILGEIPEYNRWEEQFYTKLRYIWIDDLALGVYRRVVSRLF